MALVRGTPQLLVETDANGGLGFESRDGRSVRVATRDNHVEEHAAMGMTTGAAIPTGWFDILPYWDLANVSGDTAAGLTTSVDYNVTFAGRPTIRIDVPAGTSGAKSLIGTSAATAYIPNPWDLKNLCVAVRCTNTAIFPSLSQTIADATLTNRWNKDKTKEGHPDGYSFPNRNNEWCFLKCGSATAPAAIAVTAGSPVVANRMRAKFATTLTSSTSNESIWIGFFGILPARKKPTVIVSMDDGYLTWYDFIRPLAKYYNIPVSMSIVGGLLGSGNKMSIAQAQELANDSSRLFDFTNHTYDHLTLVPGVNESAQIANFQKNRDFLRNTIGVLDDGPLHLIYPGGVTSLAQYAQAKAAGFLTGRKNQLCWMHGQDQTLASGEDDGRFVQNIVTVLDDTQTIAQVKTAVDGIVTRNEVGILEGHNSAATSAADTWSRQNYEELFADLAARRDAGTVEVKSISRWYADLTGRPCSLL
jgi:peptidoglycan/xylan/chitin deacetylase (PgdA/CDA1 family)